MFVTLWEFEVKPGSEELFEQAYGHEGAWERLFRRDERYGGTRLLREVGAERIYVTMDSWDSPAAYAEFRNKYAAEYAELDRTCDPHTSTEKYIGSF